MREGPRESAIVRAIVGWLRSVPGCVVRKRHGGPASVAGDPDLYGCHRCQHFELEVKRPGEQPTALQRYRLEEWASAGAKVAVVTSVDEVRRLFEEWFEIGTGSQPDGHQEQGGGR